MYVCLFDTFQLKSAWKCDFSRQKMCKTPKLTVYVCLFDTFQLKSAWKCDFSRQKTCKTPKPTVYVCLLVTFQLKSAWKCETFPGRKHVKHPNRLCMSVCWSHFNLNLPGNVRLFQAENM